MPSERQRNNLPPERQLETCLTDPNGFRMFLSSKFAEIPQICSVKFETMLRRIAFQAITKEDVEATCSVLRIIRFLCDQNHQRGIHVLIASGLSGILDRILAYVCELVIETKPPQRLHVLELFMETITLLIPILRDNCKWFISIIIHLLTILCKCYLELEISSMLVESLNEIMSSLSRDHIYSIRTIVCTSDKIMAMCYHMMRGLDKLGDYGTQMGISEMMVRITPTTTRQSKSMEWNKNDNEMSKCFVDILYDEFDETVRTFLNSVNRKRVPLGITTYSISQITIGSDTYKERCWLDLCFRSKKIGISFMLQDDEHTQIFEAFHVGMMSSHTIEEKQDFIQLDIKTKLTFNRLFDDDTSFNDANHMTLKLTKENVGIREIQDKFNLLLRKRNAIPMFHSHTFTHTQSSVSAQNSQSASGKQSQPKAGFLPCNSTSSSTTTRKSQVVDALNTSLSQNIVLTSQPLKMKESKSATALPINVESRQSGSLRQQHGRKLEIQKIQVKKHKMQEMNVSLEKKSIPLTSVVAQQHRDDNSLNTSLNRSHNTSISSIRQAVSVKMSQPITAFLKGNSEEFVPETQVSTAANNLNDSIQLHLSQLHARIENNQQSKEDCNHTPKKTLASSAENITTSRHEVSHHNFVKTSKVESFPAFNILNKSKESSTSKSLDELQSKPHDHVRANSHDFVNDKDRSKINSRERGVVSSAICRNANDDVYSCGRQEFSKTSESVLSRDSCKTPSQGMSSASCDKVLSGPHGHEIPRETSGIAASVSKGGTSASDEIESDDEQDQDVSVIVYYSGDNSASSNEKKINESAIVKNKTSDSSTGQMDSASENKYMVLRNHNQKHIADKVNAQFKNLEENLGKSINGTPKKAEKKYRESNPFLSTEGTTESSSETTILQTLAENSQKNKKKAKKGKGRGPKHKLIASKPTETTDSSANEMRAKRSTRKVTMLKKVERLKRKLSAEDVAIEIMNDPSSDEEPQLLRREINADQITTGIAISDSPGGRSSENDNMNDDSLKKQKQRASVTFDPYSFGDFEEENITTAGRKRPKGGRKKDKLFDSSGVSSTCSTSSDLSWIRIHKKNLRFGNEVPAKPQAKSYVVKKKPAPKLNFIASSANKETTMETSSNKDSSVQISSQSCSSPEIERNVNFSPKLIVERMNVESLSKSFIEIVEEEENKEKEKKERDEMIKFGSSRPSIEPWQEDVLVSLQPHSHTSTSTLKHKTSKLNMTPSHASQYSHISVIKSPIEIVKTPLTSNIPNEIEESLNDDLETLPLWNVVTLPPCENEDPLSPLSGNDEKKKNEFKALIGNKQRKKNITTPIDPLLVSGYVDYPNRKYKPSKRKATSVISSDCSDEEVQKKSSKFQKKLSFEKSTTDSVFYESPLHKLNDSTTSSVEGDDHISSTMKLLMSQMKTFVSCKRGTGQQPIKRVCHSLNHNMKEVQNVWTKFYEKRDDDLSQFGEKFSLLTNQHVELMKKMKEIESETKEYFQMKQQQLHDLLDASSGFLNELKSAKLDLDRVQSSNEVEFDEKMKALHDQVTEDLKKIVESVKF